MVAERFLLSGSLLLLQVPTVAFLFLVVVVVLCSIVSSLFWLVWFLVHAASGIFISGG
jgi:hypothetical protein